MPISEHLEEFGGFAVQDYNPVTGIGDTIKTIYRITHDPDTKPKVKTAAPGGFLGIFGGHKTPPPPPPTAGPLESFLADPKCREVKGIVYGFWMEGFDMEVTSEKVILNLVAAAGKLPNLTALFIGDLTYEECEISWMNQSDVTPLVWAYPKLEHLGVRGSNGLTIGPVNHTQLKSLTIQCGGLPAEVLREVLESDLPALEHLELWLGEENYGADIKIPDLAPLLEGKLFPKLRYLGLRDSELADEIAESVARAPITNRISTLDLSLGNLSDKGAKWLIESPAVARLKKLDIHHHYLSPDMMKKLQGLGPEVDVSERQEPDKYGGEEYRTISVGE